MSPATRLQRSREICVTANRLSGGRTGASVELLGLAKIVLGLAFGQKCLTLLTSCVFPYAVLGVMLAISVGETTGFGRFVWQLAFMLRECWFHR